MYRKCNLADVKSWNMLFGKVIISGSVLFISEVAKIIKQKGET